jgi:peptidoglycan lytic transglycosylase G
MQRSHRFPGPSLRLWCFIGLLAGSSCSGPKGPVVRITVPKGASLRAVEESLAAHHLVSSRPWFRVVGKLGGFEHQLKPGIYAFAPGTSSIGMLRDIRNGRYLRVRVTMPEGYTLVDMADAAAASLGLSPDSVLVAARDTALLREHGVAAPTAEGYLAPDTYIVPAQTTARELVVILLEQFQARWDSTWDAQLAQRHLNRHQALTLASIVEGEARVDEERPVIAGVYLNRLRIGMPLQADPTVQYAIQQSTGQRKPRLIYADYRVKSPYNTYLMPGLPPGPVGAPSQASIAAVIHPAQVPFLYFVAGPDGRHVFSRTYGEHLRAVAHSREESKAVDGGRRP